MLVYKIDILSALKNKGYTSYRLQKENLLSGSTLVKLKGGDMVSIQSLEKICKMLECDIGDIITLKED